MGGYFWRRMYLGKNIKIFLNYFLGPLVFLWFTFSLIRQVRTQPHLESSKDELLAAVSGPQGWKLWVILLLMVLNWGVEARKWQVLMKPLQRISLWRSFKATLTGVAVAMNMPNRIGEYGGRILYVNPEHRLRAVSLTVVGSFSQTLITFLLGCGGLLFLLNVPVAATSPGKTESYVFWIQLLLNIVIVMSALGTLIYFRLGWIIRMVDKLPPLRKLTPYIAVLEELHPLFLLRICSLSLTRYVVFIFQYMLMVELLGIAVSPWEAFWLITLVFLILAIVPTIALAELGLRGQVSVELFGLFSSNKIAIIAAAAGIWFINLVIPALLGSLLILSIKIFKNR